MTHSQCACGRKTELKPEAFLLFSISGTCFLMRCNKVVEIISYHLNIVISDICFTDDVDLCMELDPGTHTLYSWFPPKIGCDTS